MPFIQIMLLSLGVAADAFACSIVRGTVIRVNLLKRALVLAGTFGVFQAVMPLAGWVIGYFFSGIGFIASIDHWIAFALLAAVGAKMLWDAFHPEAEERIVDDGRVQIRPAIILGIATSIDALAVGVGLAFVDVSILKVALSMGVITFIMSLLGAWIGHHGGGKFGKWATVIGGLVLIGIGTNIVIEHLMA
ncbi:Putative manganese efflux pump MntP [Corynebacterium deserti GIMN1.010]|uniref:Putative manganese efflux pump MntP n=1 Tax=Corynebacterium deserti GIMN1.010 TaxID=931089 RepID=A0A0M4CXW4_9CORY|nr:manganese efflux pump MntP family protein [Corynebacterium deserti]ALC05832.1 Putative manganese efflux pump MntP [Corynebacterium deserti GIMN1.010]